MCDKHFLKCSTSLSIKEIQIKTNFKFPVRIENRSPNDNECWHGCGERKMLKYSWWK